MKEYGKHIISWAVENEVDSKWYTLWHLSLQDKGKRLDIFPKSGKYHNVKTDKRGVITGDLIDFLDNWLNDVREPTASELLATYINNRYGTDLTPQHAEEIRKHILSNK